MPVLKKFYASSPWPSYYFGGLGLCCFLLGIACLAALSARFVFLPLLKKCDDSTTKNKSPQPAGLIERVTKVFQREVGLHAFENRVSAVRFGGAINLVRVTSKAERPANVAQCFAGDSETTKQMGLAHSAAWLHCFCIVWELRTWLAIKWGSASIWPPISYVAITFFGSGSLLWFLVSEVAASGCCY